MRSEKSQIRNPHSPTVDFPLPAALCPSRALHRADWRAPSIPLSLPISLSLGVDRSELLFSLFVSRFIYFLLLLFFLFFLLSATLDLWFGVLWRVLFITPKAFFFFFFLSHSLLYFTVYIYIYIYIYCFFTQPCLINYNVHYEFSDFCFCVSYYSFIYLLKLNIVGDFTKVRFCDFCFCASCLISFYVFSLMLNVAYLNFWFVL